MQLDRSIIIKQPNNKGSNQQQTLMLLDTFIIIHHFRSSRPPQQKTFILLNNLFSAPKIQSEKPQKKKKGHFFSLTNYYISNPYLPTHKIENTQITPTNISHLTTKSPKPFISLAKLKKPNKPFTKPVATRHPKACHYTTLLQSLSLHNTLTKFVAT